MGYITIDENRQTYHRLKKDLENTEKDYKEKLKKLDEADEKLQKLSKLISPFKELYEKN